MLIQAKNIKKEYGNEELITKILHGLTFEIEKGEFLSIMGPSGSGKSTLMHILGLLDKPTTGKYIFEGTNISELSEDELAILRNEKIGFVFQAFHLLPKTTVLENTILPLTYSNKKIDHRKRAREVLESVGLGHRLNYYSNQISGGEKQRVAIARSLVNDPEIIFADEPTGNLDSKSGKQVMEILQDLNDKGKTVILVTHESSTAKHADRIIQLKDGLIVDDGPVTKKRLAKNESGIK
jgi:putative ABC transport system ATP-binding protein